MKYRLHIEFDIEVEASSAEEGDRLCDEAIESLDFSEVYVENTFKSVGVE